MKRFDRIKTVQLVLQILIAVLSLAVIWLDPELYAAIASDPHVRLLAVFLWILLGTSFLFLLYDFNSWSDLKRENLELDHAIYADALTGIANRYSVDVYIGRYQNQPVPPEMGCVTLEISNLAEINGKAGHSGGDAALQAFSDILQREAGESGFIGRNGGNKFVAIFRECTGERLEEFSRAVTEQVKKRNAGREEGGIAFRQGMAREEQDQAASLAELIAISDHRAWQAEEER